MRYVVKQLLCVHSDIGCALPHRQSTATLIWIRVRAGVTNVHKETRPDLFPFVSQLSEPSLPLSRALCASPLLNPASRVQRSEHCVSERRHERARGRSSRIGTRGARCPTRTPSSRRTSTRDPTPTRAEGAGRARAARGIEQCAAAFASRGISLPVRMAARRAHPSHVHAVQSH